MYGTGPECCRDCGSANVGLDSVGMFIWNSVVILGKLLRDV